MNQAIITTANAARWSAALDRAIANALDVLIATDGSAYVESASKPGLIYSVSREFCSCPAGAKNQICMHRAVYLCQVGELPLDPEPEARIQFVCENSDRYEIVVDGEFFGHAVADRWGGWEAFAGQFPNARRFPQVDGCTLDEVERQLIAQLPAMLPVQPEVRVVELGTVAA